MRHNNETHRESPDSERSHDRGHRGHARHHHQHHHHHDPGGFGRGPHRRGGWGGPGFRGERGGRRAGRGDIRAAVITLLAEEPMHGYQIIQELAERSGGAWRPSPGSIYPALQLLQDEGLVTADERDGKRVFTLTEAGRTEAASRADGPTPWEAAARGEGSDVAALRQLAEQLLGAVAQVASAGTPAQIETAKTLLGSTRRDLYRLLADDTDA
jgi:DNA-binding PadR family transcriptional regulator